MPNDNTITAVILCKNAESTLAQVLESVAFCDHIIIGDDGSTDESPVIARKFHADIIKISPGKNFSQMRNYLLQYVQTEWTLFIDSDEIVTPTLAKEITTQLHSTTANGFLIRRMDIFMGEKLSHGETANTWILRLARTTAGNWQRAVHEVWSVSGRIERLEHEILHYSHPDIEEFMDKINRYTELEVDERSRHAHRFGTYIKLFVFPVAKFVQNYILRFGILDGFQGFVMAYMMSFHSLCVRIKMLEQLQSPKTK